MCLSISSKASENVVYISRCITTMNSSEKNNNLWISFFLLRLLSIMEVTLPKLMGCMQLHWTNAYRDWFVCFLRWIVDSTTGSSTLVDKVYSCIYKRYNSRVLFLLRLAMALYNRAILITGCHFTLMLLWDCILTYNCSLVNV